MSWVAVGVTAVGAISGAQQAKRQREAQEGQNEAAAAQTRYSPWTGMGSGQINTSPTQSGLEGALGGGLKGFMTGSSIKGAMGAKPTAAPDAGGFDAASKEGLQYSSPTVGAMGAAPAGGAPMPAPGGAPAFGQPDPNGLPQLAMNRKPSLYGR